MTTINPTDVFPDAEAAVSKAIRAGLPGTRVYSSIPKRPTYPLVLVRRYGGVPVMRRRLDMAEIQLDVYGSTKSEARLLASQVRAAIHEAEATTVEISTGDAWISGVKDTQGLLWMPDEINPDLNRYIFSVSVYLHAA